MSINRGMNEEDVEYTYNEISPNHKKERNCALCSDMDELRDCHKHEVKSKREKQISYINVYVWNLEKWYR